MHGVVDVDLKSARTVTGRARRFHAGDDDVKPFAIHAAKRPSAKHPMTAKPSNAPHVVMYCSSQRCAAVACHSATARRYASSSSLEPVPVSLTLAGGGVGGGPS